MPSLTQLITAGSGSQADRTIAASLPLGGAEVAGLYLHVPFCAHKCHYCDFYSLVDGQDRQAAFVGRLVAEIEAARPYLRRPIETIFVGGGTPTLLEAGLWKRLLRALGSLERAAPLEFTVEANPETVTETLVGVLAAGGVRRMSIGAQSFRPESLAALERRHDPANVARSVHLIRAGGIDDVNLDLIFGIPGQDLTAWLADLDAALDLGPDHLSCYALTYEPNTPLAGRLARGEVERVDEALEADMYLATLDRLAAAGFEHYEISNWARPGRRCRHNLLYWRNGSWWPLGPSAAGHVEGVRWRNAPRLGEYLAGDGLPAITDVERLDDDGRIGELLMLRLRLVDGLALDELDTLLSRGTRGDARRRAIAIAEEAGRLTRAGGRLRFTREGFLLADGVLAELL